MAGEIHEVEGYAICERGPHWVLREIANRTGGLCSDCFAEVGGNRLRPIEVIGRGARLNIPKSRPRRRREQSAARRASRKTAAKARDSARKRLAAMFPDLYEIVLAEERALLGLEPWTVDAALRRREDPDGSIALGFAELDLTLEREGIDVS